VYVSACEHIFGTKCPIFTNSVHEIHLGCCSILLWRRCDALRTSSLWTTSHFTIAGCKEICYVAAASCPPCCVVLVASGPSRQRAPTLDESFVQLRMPSCVEPAIRAFQFGIKKFRFDSIRQTDKFAVCTLIFK